MIISCCYVSIWGVVVLEFDGHPDHNKRQEPHSDIAAVDTTF